MCCKKRFEKFENSKIQELKDAETNKDNNKASVKTKLKNLGLNDDEIKALMGA